MKATLNLAADFMSQLKRTEGQVLSIGRMVEEERSCSEILQQLVAARASLGKLGTILLEREAMGCVGPGCRDKLHELERAVQGLFKLS